MDAELLVELRKRFVQILEIVGHDPAECEKHADALMRQVAVGMITAAAGFLNEEDRKRFTKLLASSKSSLEDASKKLAELVSPEDLLMSLRFSVQQILAAYFQEVSPKLTDDQRTKLLDLFEKTAASI
jgi:hypothetical protein